VELFGSRTRPAFDELGAARTLSQMVVDAILQRERAARVVQFATRGAGPHLTLSDVIDQVVAATWGDGPSARPAATPKLAALRRVTQRAVADRLMQLAADEQASPEVRAMADLKISELRPTAAGRARLMGNDDERAHWLAIANDLAFWMEKRELPKTTQALAAPPGDPF
jgi:hypothetical protein